MNLWKLPTSKRAVIAAFLSLVLTLSGVDVRGIAVALADTAEPVEEAILANQDVSEAESALEQVVEETESNETEPVAAEMGTSDNEAAESELGAIEAESGGVDEEPGLDDGREQVEGGAAREEDSAWSLSASSDTSLTPSQSAGGVTATLTWVTEDSTVAMDWAEDQDPSKLELIPGYEGFGSYSGDDSELSLEACLELTLSGESNYEPGMIQITLPAQFVKDRADSYIGSMSVDLPEDPDTSQDFSYRLVSPSDGSDPYYLVTNTRVLEPGTTCTINFSYDGITPHEVKSGAEHALQAKLIVTSADGNDVVTDTNELVAMISTHEGFSGVRKNGGAVVDASDAPDAILTALSTVADDADDYVLVRWNTYASVQGNQTFTLTMTDALNGEFNGREYPAIKKKDGGETVGSTGSVVLGTSTNAADDPTSSFSLEVIKDGYLATGETQYETVWTAYPKSLFEDNTTYELTNTVTWTITSTDGSASYGDYEDSVFLASSITYENTSTGFEVAENNYRVDKGTLEPHAYETSDNTALSELAAGDNVTIGFTVAGSGEIMKQTMAAGDETSDVDIEAHINDGTKTVDDYYHKRCVTLEVADDALYLNEEYGSELTASDYYVSKVNVQDPLVYTYEQVDDDASSWDFVRDTTGQLPDMALYGLTETEGGTAETWTELATVSYLDANARTVKSETSGVSVSGTVVSLDESLGVVCRKLVSSIPARAAGPQPARAAGRHPGSRPCYTITPPFSPR